MLLIGGNCCGATRNTVERYNPKDNQWTMCAPMHAERYLPSAVVVRGKLYVLGGLDNDNR